jgi:hypothetical protein
MKRLLFLLLRQKTTICNCIPPIITTFFRELAAIKASQGSVVSDQMSFVEEPIIEISDSPEPRLIEASEKS